MPKILMAPRASLHISRHATQNGFRAFDYANDTQRRINLFVVVNLIETPARSAETIIEKLMHKFRDWLSNRYRRSGMVPAAPAYTLSRENPGDVQPHLNWPLHLPRAFHSEFCKKLPGWLHKAQQSEPRPFDVIVQDVVLGTEKRLAKYVYKGTDPAYIEHFHLKALADQHGPQGTVHGTRTKVSRALNATARREAGWRPRKGRRPKPPA